MSPGIPIALRHMSMYMHMHMYMLHVRVVHVWNANPHQRLAWLDAPPRDS